MDIQKHKNTNQISAPELEKNSNNNLFLAKHITLDYYDCDDDIIFDPEALEKTLLESARAIWATIISSHFNKFEPQWVSWVVVLAESHITIHTWPEYGYAAIDMFTCGDMDMQKGIDLLSNAFKTNKVELVTDLKRGMASNLSSKNDNLNPAFNDRDSALDQDDWNFSKDKNNLVLDKKNNNWEEEFNNSQAWWIASSVDVFWCNPKLIRDAWAIREYVSELCNLIQMKTFWDTQIVHFWEDEKVAWYSMTQLIETSLISGHFANATNAAYLDIFSCKYYDPWTVADFTVRYFKWKYYKLNINIRDEK